ncbi:hypothetical protein VP193E371_P0242 [Vibrio phage 193E37-1]|nr:hypothetical protein VP193E371_P0242 [Vibrio phage 193E37-1]
MSDKYNYTNPYPDDITGCILDKDVLFSSDTYDLGLYNEEMRMVDYMNVGVYLQQSCEETSSIIRGLQYNVKGWGY